MNLRKDHSHANCIRYIVNSGRGVLPVCVKNTVRKLEGSGAVWAILFLRGASALFSLSNTFHHSLKSVFLLATSVDESFTTFSDGYLGSNNDEGRSEV